MLEFTKDTMCDNEDQNSFSLVDRQQNTVDITKERPFTCCYDDCNKSYIRLSHLKRHEDTHENSYRCTEKNCEQSFKSQFTLKKHIDNIHLKKNPKKYKCSICNQDFNKRSWLTRHQYRHTGVKPYVCSKEGCDKRFLVPSKLKRHLKIHEGYTCSKENCGQKFSKWTLYIKHVKTSHPTIHKCQYCEREFVTSSNLKAHSEVHKFDREVYLCPKPNCSRFYFMKRNLTHHLKSYHEKRPFICMQEHCFKAFMTEEDLNAHVFRHDPKKCARKRKKSNPKPSFAARLAGCVPRKVTTQRKTTEQETEGEASEVCSNVCEKNVLDISLNENNQDVPTNVSTDNVSTCSVDDKFQTILNMKETMLERKSLYPESNIKCISA